MRKRIACSVAAVLPGAAAAAAAMPQHACGNAFSHDARTCLESPHHCVASDRQDTARARNSVRNAAWRGLVAGGDDAGRLLWWYSAATGRESRRLAQGGEVLERRYANGDTRSCRYDEDGRPVEAISASASGALRTVIEWRGNGTRRILHPHEEETRRHDAHGRLVGRVVHRPALSAHESDYSYREVFAWDAAARLLRHDLPEGGSLTHEYDEHGRVVRIEWRERRQRRTLLPLAAPADAAHGGSESNDDGAARKADGANSDGELKDDDHPRGNGDSPAGSGARGGSASHRNNDAAATPPMLHQRLHHDPVGRLWGRRLQIGNWHAAWAYAYGADAEMIGAAVRMHGVPAPRAQAQTQTQVIQGDAAAAEPRIQRQWLYAWRPSGAALATRADALTLRHDVQRDPGGLPARAGGRRLEYGPDRRLRSVWENGKQLAHYVHNARGERIRRYDATGIRHYLYGRDHRLAAEARPLPGGAVGVTRRYVYAGASPVAIIEYPHPRALVARPSATAPAAFPPVFYAVHTDPGGVPYAVTDAALRIRWRAIMSPTGMPVAEEGDLPVPLRGPGHVRDEASGWHDDGRRTYDPQAGHYLEPDPTGPMGGGSPYGYPGLAAVPQPLGNGEAAGRMENDDGDGLPRPVACVPRRCPGKGVATAQDDAVTVDIRGYGKWLREALAPDTPPPRGGGSG